MYIETTLKDKGYKITLPRKEVGKLLINHPSDDHTVPLSIQDISEDLTRKNVKIDLVSIYRTLELFISLGIVHEIDFGEGRKRYEIFNATHHHHHAICEHCGNITEISVPLEKQIINQVQTNTGFVINKHTLEFFGLCSACQQRKI